MGIRFSECLEFLMNIEHGYVPIFSNTYAKKMISFETTAFETDFLVQKSS